MGISDTESEVSAWVDGEGYEVQLSCVQFLTLWLKSYFMEDFADSLMTQRVQQFVRRIKALSSKQRLPSIPDTHRNTHDIEQRAKGCTAVDTMVVSGTESMDSVLVLRAVDGLHT